MVSVKYEPDVIITVISVIFIVSMSGTVKSRVASLKREK